MQKPERFGFATCTLPLDDALLRFDNVRGLTGLEKRATPLGERSMHRVSSSVFRFLVDDSGPAAVEYAVLMMVIFLIVIGSIGSLGQTTAALFQSNANKLPPP